MLMYKVVGACARRSLLHPSIHRTSYARFICARTMLRWIHRTLCRSAANEDRSKDLGIQLRIPNSSSILGWQENESFFHFTRGRFVSNEEFEMSQRCVQFNMDKLAQIAASTVDSRRCVTVEKYPDGQFSKVFLMTMENGKQVVAKVPNPNAGQSKYTTASEVATMEFVIFQNLLDQHC